MPLRVTGGSVVLAGWLTLAYNNIVAERYPDLGAAHWPLTLLVPALFAVSILLHEAAHAAAGHRCGSAVRWVVLDGLGGETAFDRDPATPGRSAVIAAAGPTASLALAVLFNIAAHAAGSGGPAGFILSQLALGNLIITVFNLLPGLPLDGGHVLHAGIWKVIGNPRAATTATAILGLVTAAALVVVPVAVLLNAGGRPSLVGLALLLFIAAPMAHGAWTALHEPRYPAADRPPTAYELSHPAITVTANQSAHEGLRLLTARDAAALVVWDPNLGVLGILTDSDMLAVPATEQHRIPLGALTSRTQRPPLVPGQLAGDDLAAYLRHANAPAYLIYQPDISREPRVFFAAHGLDSTTAMAGVDVSACYPAEDDHRFR